MVKPLVEYEKIHNLQLYFYNLEFLPVIVRFYIVGAIEFFSTVILQLFLGKFSDARKQVQRYAEQAKSAQSNNVEQKVAIVTGSNAGIGYATVRALLQAGYRVIMACRSSQKAKAAVTELKKELGTDIAVDFMELDLSSLQSVRTFVQHFLKLKIPLHLLINNAGVMFTPYQETKDKFEMQFGVNYLSPFLLIELLKDKLIESAPSKIINLSSLAHYGAEHVNCEYLKKENYNRFRVYSISKLAQVIATYKHSKQLRSKGVSVYSVHPGMVATLLFRNLPFNALVNFLNRSLVKSPDVGCLSTIKIALDLNEDSITAGDDNKRCLYFADEIPMAPNPVVFDTTLQDQLYSDSLKLVGLSSH